MGNRTDILTERPFETAHLGGPVFDCADANDAAEAVKQGRDAGAVLISCRTEGEGKALSAAGFRKVESLVTLECSSFGTDGVSTGKIQIRAGGPADIPACRRIATEALRWDRFHADTRIDDGAADGLKADWIENDLRGRADRVFVAETGGAVAGFCAMLMRRDLAVIDLIAVAPDRQGKGIGRAMVAGAIDYYRGRVATMRVGTQAANPQSLTFYRSLGFVEVGRADTWHWMP